MSRDSADTSHFSHSHFFVCDSDSKWTIFSLKIQAISKFQFYPFRPLGADLSHNNVLNLFTVNVSEEFEHFLELMGDKIELKGWRKYRGGLDVKSKIKLS